jgi:hypothetical protein
MAPDFGQDYYIFTVNVTNVGEGPACGVTVSPPDIPSASGAASVYQTYAPIYGVKDGAEPLYLGDIEPGTSTYGEFRVYAPGISDWQNLPASQSNG